MTRRSSTSVADRAAQRLAGTPGRTDLAAALIPARERRRDVIDGCSNADVIDAIARTARDWLEDRDSILTRTAAELEPVLGLAAGMLERGLGYTFGALDRDALEQLVARQAEDPRALERSVASATGRPRRLLGPEVVLHMLAGNVPGLAVPAIAVSLLARSVVVVRDSARQPLLTARFLATLAAHAPDLAAMVVPVAWRSEDGEAPIELVRSVDRVELYGADDTIARLSDAFADIEVVRRGTRVSAALVTGDRNAGETGLGDGGVATAMTASTAMDIAIDVAMDVVMYDGLGCLSPSVVIVEGTAARAERFAVALGDALQALERRWPRRRRDVRTEASRRAFLDAAEAAEVGGRGRLVGEAVRFDPDGGIECGPGARCVAVVPARDRAATLDKLRAAASPLAAVGVAPLGASSGGSSGTSQAAASGGVPSAALVEQLEGAGAAIVCAAGHMQAPPIDRDPDGGRRLADLLRWREVEA